MSNEAILDATRAMLNEVVFADFSVRELAKALGVVPGTIYARFGTKDELLVQLYIQTLDRVSDLLDDFAVTPDVRVVDAVRAMLPVARPADLAAAARLARTGPPQELVGLEPYGRLS